MKKILSYLAIISISLSLVILFHSLFILNANVIKEIPIKLEISQVIGFEVNETALTFGKIPPGASSTKKVILTNNEERNVRVILKVDDTSSSIVKLTEDDLILKPQETKIVYAVATAPSIAKNKQYEGKIKIYVLNA